MDSADDSTSIVSIHSTDSANTNYNSSEPKTDIISDSEDSVEIIAISSDDEVDDNFDSFEFEIKTAHKKTLVCLLSTKPYTYTTIPLAFWQHHRLDLKQRVYIRFGNASRSYVVGCIGLRLYRIFLDFQSWGVFNLDFKKSLKI